MGSSLSWLAAHADATSTLTTLGLRPTGTKLEGPEAPLVGAGLGNGWYLVVAHGCDHVLVGDRTLATLSARVDVVACALEEHVMHSQAAQWIGGTKIWSAEHDSQVAVEHLVLLGALPPFAAEIRDATLAAQAAEGGAAAEVDYVFDVPLEIARRITDFKHDDGGPQSYEVLEILPKSLLVAQKAWWRLW